MAEIRRRRKCSGEDSDILSDVSAEILIKSLSEHGSDADNSDYESIDEGQTLDEEDAEIAAITSNDPEDQEEKKLDDDEDRKNPQYIPKKGTFYEHDNRIGSETEEVTEKTPTETGVSHETKKKIWKENDSWQHDKYDFNDQIAKTRDELVASYGYDIRNEEGPPRARRRRRYGRGPNKYTRNWEDVEAYKPTRGRASAELRRGKPRSHNIDSESDFPPLRSNDNRNKGTHDMEDAQGQQDVVTVGVHESRSVLNDGNHISPSDNGRDYRDHNYTKSYKDNYNAFRGRGNYNRGGRGDNRKYQQRYGRENYSEGSFRGRNDYRAYNQRGGYSSKPNSADYKDDIQEVSDMLKSVEISSQKDDYRLNRNESKKPNMPPRLQEKERSPKTSPSQVVDVKSKTTKRYSTQRQRAIADHNPSFQHTYYEEPLKHSTPNKNYVQPTYSSTSTPFQAENYIPRVAGPQIIAPATRPHIITGPPMPTPAPIPGVVAVPPTFVGPAIGPNPTAAAVPPFLTTDNIINYGPTPGLVAAPPQFPPFQTFSAVPQGTPTEVYRNGVTYYSTQNQQQPRTSAPLQKRMKSAIPILPPPEDDESGIKFENIGYQEVSDEDSLSLREYEDAELSVHTLASDDLVYDESVQTPNETSEVYEAGDNTAEESTSSNLEILPEDQIVANNDSGVYPDDNLRQQVGNPEVFEDAIPVIKESFESYDEEVSYKQEDLVSPKIDFPVKSESLLELHEVASQLVFNESKETVSSDNIGAENQEERLVQNESMEDRASYVNSSSENANSNETSQTEDNVTNDKLQTEDNITNDKLQTENSVVNDNLQTEDNLNNEKCQTEDSVINDKSQPEDSVINEKSQADSCINIQSTTEDSTGT